MFRRTLLLLLLVFVSGCSGAKSAATNTPPPPTSTPLPASPTPLPSPTWTATPSPTPTHTPTVTPTPGPYADLIVSGSFQVTYKRADWEGDAMGLLHRSMEGCEVQVGVATQWPAPPQRTRLFGYPFEMAEASGDGQRTRIYRGPLLPGWEVDPMVVAITAPSERFTACEQAALNVLRSFHFRPDEQENCPYAMDSPFQVGMKVRTVDYVYVRSEPRWAEETRLQQLPPGAEMTIIGGPVCAPYDKGVYVYWQVRLPNGAEVWIAEGDPQGPYIAP